MRKDDEWLRLRRAELKALKISELRTLLSSHGTSAAEVLAARKKDALLMALMKKEVAAEVRGRLDVLRAARRRRRRVWKSIRGDDDEEEEEEEEEEERRYSLLSFSEQVTMLHEATKLVRAAQRTVLLEDGDEVATPSSPAPTLSSLASPAASGVPWDRMDAVDVIDGFADCIRKRYETCKKHRTLYAEMRAENSADQRGWWVTSVVDFDPDEGDMKLWVVIKSNGSVVECIEEKREVLELMLSGFSINEKFARNRLLDASIRSQRQRIKSSWRRRIGEVVDAQVIERGTARRGAQLLLRAPPGTMKEASPVLTTEAVLEDSHAIPGETLLEGDELKVVVVGVARDGRRDAISSGITVSRSDASLVAGLVRQEVLAVREGDAEIFGIARVAGVACKIGIEIRDGDRGGTETLRYQIVQALIRLGKMHFDREEIYPVFEADRETMVAEALSFNDSSELEVHFKEIPQYGGRDYCEVECPEHLRAKIIGHDGSNVQLASSLLNTNINIVHKPAPADAEGAMDGDDLSLPFAGEDDLDLLSHDLYSSSPDPSSLASSSMPSLPWASSSSGEMTVDEEFDDLVGRHILYSGDDTSVDSKDGVGAQGEEGGKTIVPQTLQGSDELAMFGSGVDDELADFVQRVFDENTDRTSAGSHLRAAHENGDVDYLDMARTMTSGRGDGEGTGATDAPLEGAGDGMRSLASMIDDVLDGLDDGGGGDSEPDRSHFTGEGGMAIDAAAPERSVPPGKDRDLLDDDDLVFGLADPVEGHEASAAETSSGAPFADEVEETDEDEFFGGSLEVDELSRAGFPTSIDDILFDDGRGAAVGASDFGEATHRQPGGGSQGRKQIKSALDKPIHLQLGPLFFPHRQAAFSFFQTLLWETKLGYTLNADEMAAFVELVERAHPNPAEKLGAEGLDLIYVGHTVKEVQGAVKKVRAFILQRKDGTEDDCSYRKLLTRLFHAIENDVIRKVRKRAQRSTNE